MLDRWEELYYRTHDAEWYSFVLPNKYPKSRHNIKHKTHNNLKLEQKRILLSSINNALYGNTLLSRRNSLHYPK